MRRSFRTLRLCAVPGVSPRAGIRCPVGALRTPHLPRASLASAGPIPRSTPYAQRSGIGPQRALEANTKNPSRKARKPHPPPSFLRERRTDPAERATNTHSGGFVTTTPWDGLGYAAFLQNAPVVRRTRGFTPGWYTVPRWGTPNASPAPSFLSERRTDPAEHQNTPSGAGSVRSEPWKRSPKSLAQSAKARPPPSFLSERRTGPAERATNTHSGGSVTTTPWDGLGYAAFLQNAPVVRRTRGFTPGWYTVPRWGTPNASPAPSFLSERRTDPAEHPIRPAERDRSAASLGSDHQNPSRKARKPNPPPSFLSERRTDPAEPPKRQAERDRSAASIEGDHQSPSRKARKPHPPPSLPASVGPIPRSISTLAQGQRQPLTPRAPCQIGASL
jgi:hypothetical protein